MLTRLANEWLPRVARRSFRLGWLRLRNLAKYGDAHWYGGVSVEISTACNRACKYCPVAEFPRKQELIAEEQFQRICERVVESGEPGSFDFIHFNEPLLHPNVVKLVEIAARIMPTSCLTITSNGDRLTKELCWMLKRAGLTQLLVTRHPPYSVGWDMNLAVLRGEFPGLINFLESPGDEGWSNRAGLVKPPGPSKLKKCIAPENLTVKMNGDVIVCCNDYFGKVVIGNIFAKSLEEIYGEPRWRKWRKLIRRGVPASEMCRKCMS